MNFLTASVEIILDDSMLKRQLVRAKSLVSKTVSGMGSLFGKMSGMLVSSFQKAFHKILRYAKWAFLGIATLAVKSFASFDDAMQKSIAIMSGITEKVRNKMMRVAQEISLRSITSATDLAKAYFYLASAGLSAEQSIAALGTMEDFAAAGAFDMALATDLVTDAQSALGMTVKDVQQNMKNMTRIQNVLIGANTLANASTQQYAEALMRAGPDMKAYHIELEEGVAVLAAFADQSKKSFEGGDLFGRMLRLMIGGFISNRKVWKDFGIEIENSKKRLRPLADIIRDLTNLLDPMGVTQKAATLEMLGFSKLAQKAILPLLGTADAVDEYLKKLLKMKDVMQRVKDIQLKSFAAQMKIVWNNIVSVAQVMGKHLAPDIKALGDVFRDNRDTIERWAVTFVEYVLYAKNIAVAFVKFLWSDWKSGIKTGLDISIELFKAFGKILMVIMEDIFTRLYNNIGVWLKRAIARKAVFNELKRIYEAELSQEFMKELPLPKSEYLSKLQNIPVEAEIMAGKTIISPENIRAIENEFPTIERGVGGLKERIKSILGETGASIQEITLPEMGKAFDEAAEKLKKNLEAYKTISEGERTEKYLVSIWKKAKSGVTQFAESLGFIPQKTTEVVDAMNSVGDAADDAGDKVGELYKKMTEAGAMESLRRWSEEAQDKWREFSNVAIHALDSTSDALTDFVVKGQADFKSLAESIIMDLTRMIIKAQMAQMLGLLMPSWFGVGGLFNLAQPGTAANPMVVTTAPGLQHGGEVAKTGLAVVHKGETFSGVNNENGQERSVNVSLTINAIDTQSGMQFLAGHKRFLANLMRSVTKENVGRRG